MNRHNPIPAPRSFEKSPRYRWTLALMVALLGSGFLAAESFDWPQWQGPDRNGVSKETRLLPEWPEAGPPLSWKATVLGGGYSAPSVAHGQIFGMSSRGDDEVVWSVSESDGKELWVTRIGPALTEGRPQGKEGAGCTPAIDGDRLYVLVCINMNGEVQWKTKRDPDFNKGSMILVDGVILATDGANTLYVIEPDPKEFKPLDSAELLSAEGTNSDGIAARVGGSTQNWAPIALSDGKLLIRDHSRLKCVRVAE